MRTWVPEDVKMEAPFPTRLPLTQRPPVASKKLFIWAGMVPNLRAQRREEGEGSMGTIPRWPRAAMPDMLCTTATKQYPDLMKSVRPGGKPKDVAVKVGELGRVNDGDVGILRRSMDLGQDVVTQRFLDLHRAGG